MGEMMKKYIRLIIFFVVIILIIAISYLTYNKSKMHVNIDGEYSELVNDALKMIENNLKQSNLKYDTHEYKNNEVYSFLVEVKDTYPYFVSYNISLKTKQALSNEELASMFNETIDDINKKVEDRLVKYYNEEIDNGYIELNDYTFDEYLNYYRGIEDTDYCYILVVKDNKLYAYLNFEKNNTEDKEYFDKLNYNPYVIEL